MRYKLLLIALIVATLIIGTASATPPKIKKVIIDPKTDPDKFDVTVGATDDGTIKRAKSNEVNLDGHDNDWKGVDIQTDSRGIFTISVEDNNGETSKKKIGSGGCTGNYEAHKKQYQYAKVNPIPVSINATTFYLDTEYRRGASLIQVCVYPFQGFDPEIGTLDIAPLLINKWVPKHSGHQEYYGFGRILGSDNIIFEGNKHIEIGTADYGRSTDSHQILMHINDPNECWNDNDAGENAIPGETCWRRPGTTQIPEFPNVALPVAAMIGLLFLFQHRKNRKD